MKKEKSLSKSKIATD